MSLRRAVPLLAAALVIFPGRVRAEPPDVYEACQPCGDNKDAFDEADDAFRTAVERQNKAVADLRALNLKSGDAYDAAFNRAVATEWDVAKRREELDGASERLRESLQKYQDDLHEKLGTADGANNADGTANPEHKRLQDLYNAAKKEEEDHDKTKPERDQLRDRQAQNSDLIDQEEHARQNEQNLLGTKAAPAPVDRPSGQTGAKPPPPPPPSTAQTPGKSGDPTKAKDYLDKVIKQDPNNAEALGNRASANFKLGNNAAACADAKAALSQNPNHEEAFGIKQLACNAGRVTEPKPMMKLAQKPPERGPEALPASAAAAPRPPPQTLTAPAQAPGEPGMGTVALTREVGSDYAAESAIHSKAAASNLMNRNYKAAAAEADRALALNPRNAHARLMRATARNGMKNYRGALEDAEEGLKLAPKNIPLLNTKAQAQIKLKDYKGALATANEILELDPTNAAALAQKAYALGGMGDREAMLDALRRAAAMDPRFQTSLDSAMNPPANADALFYFPGEDASSEKAPASKGGFPTKIALAGLFAGGLILLIILKPSAPAAEAAVPSGTSGPVSTAPGSLLKEQYEFVREIGQGGMGAVHEAFDKKLDRKVAVKRMRDELKTDPRELAHFVQEAKIVSHLSHPYIVGIHDIVEEGGDLFLVLDFVDGQPLSTIIGERKRLSFKEAKDIMSYVCQAVDFAHKNKVTHRDLKPSNIMVDKNGFVKVMDFGLAREAKDTLSRLTRGDASGTPAYMAPEHHLGNAEPASDLFSLGVCLYEMVTGQLPYRGADLLAAKERRQYTPPRLLISTLPAGIDELMASLLSPEPDKRPAGAAQLLEQLNKLA